MPVSHPAPQLLLFDLRGVAGSGKALLYVLKSDLSSTTQQAVRDISVPEVPTFLPAWAHLSAEQVHAAGEEVVEHMATRERVTAAAQAIPGAAATSGSMSTVQLFVLSQPSVLLHACLQALFHCKATQTSRALHKCHGKEASEDKGRRIRGSKTVAKSHNRAPCSANSAHCSRAHLRKSLGRVHSQSQRRCRRPRPGRSRALHCCRLPPRICQRRGDAVAGASPACSAGPWKSARGFLRSKRPVLATVCILVLTVALAHSLGKLSLVCSAHASLYFSAMKRLLSVKCFP